MAAAEGSQNIADNWVERARGFEPPTSTLGKLHGATPSRPQRTWLGLYAVHPVSQYQPARIEASTACAGDNSAIV